MKNKLLLTILPALLVLSACQGGEQLKAENNLFLEDTLAHEEIFGGGESGSRKLVPFRINGDPVAHPDFDPAIGIQSLINDNDTVDPEDDTISFRFVAAVTLTAENIGDTVAKWTRTVSKPNGDAYSSKFDTDEVTVTKAYKKISNGGGEYSIEQFNNAQEPKTNYTHFVVYCLRNIPLLDPYNDYYVSAYLTLSGGVSQTSKAIVTSVDQSKQYSYDHVLGVSFITGEFGGTPDVIDATFIRDDMSDGNKAEFAGVTLTKGDTFVINEFYNTKLYVKNSDEFAGNSDYFFADDNGSIKANFTGTYNLFLTSGDEIHTTASRIVRPIYVRIENDSWWDASAKLLVYAYGFTGPDNSKAEKWIKVGDHLGDKYYLTVEDLDTAVYTHIIIVRENPSYPDGGWDGKWNQTSDIALPLDNKNCVFVYGDLSDSTSYSVNTASLS